MIVLETPRLVLRWFDDADAPTLVELMNDPDWLRFIGDRGVRTNEDARRYIADKILAPCWEQGFGLWAIQRKSDGALAGMCGLVKRPWLDDIDVGYALFPRHRGAGLAREATDACVRYGAEVLGLPRVLAITSPENERSIALLHAIGMTFQSSKRGPDDDRDASVFAWRADRAAVETDPRGAIDALVARFYDAFCNAERPHRLAALPRWFVKGASITTVSTGETRAQSLRDFVAPRASLLAGRLRDFVERETASETRVDGGIAQRFSRYAKSGVLDGAPFTGTGRKTMQFAKTAEGFRISGITWEDDAVA